MFEEEIRLPREKNIPVKIIVKDSDFMAQDDVLGFCDIDWSECHKHPGEWSVNNIFALDGTPDMK